MTTVLFCTDGSALAERAITTALTLLGQPLEARIVAVVEADDPSLVGGSGMAGGVMSPDEYDTMIEAERAAAEAALERARASIVAAGVAAIDVGSTVLQGDAGHEICNHAAEVGANLVVMASRGRGVVRRAVLGSVSDHVARKAPCPVLIVRDAAE